MKIGSVQISIEERKKPGTDSDAGRPVKWVQVSKNVWQIVYAD